MRIGHMLLGVALLLTLGATIGPAPARAAGPCRLSLASTMKLDSADNDTKLLVHVKANGVPLALIVDTGSENLTLTEDANRRSNRSTATGSLIPGTGDTGEGFVSGVGGASAASFVQIGNLTLGRMHGTFSASVSNQKFFAKDAADGLLGMSALANFDFDLDLPDHQLRLYFAAGDCKHPAAALDEPIYAVAMQQSYHSDVRPIIPVMINGQNFRALLDTGASGTLLFAGAAARLGLATDASSGGRTVKIGGIGGASVTTLQQLDTLVIGPLTLRKRRGWHRPRGQRGGRPAARDELHEARARLGLEFLAYTGNAVSCQALAGADDQRTLSRATSDP